jgi:hypothetical protein
MWGPPVSPFFPPPSPFPPAVFPVTTPWGQGRRRKHPRRPHGCRPPAALVAADGHRVPPVPHPSRPLPRPRNPRRRPIKPAAPISISQNRAAAHGDFSVRRKKRGGVEEKKSWGRGNWRPPMEEPEAAAPRDPLVAARPAGEAAGRGTPVHGLRSRTSSSRRRLTPEPLAGVALHHGARTGPAKGDAAPVNIFTAPSPSRTACFLFTELFNTASPERQGAGLLHQGDVAVEAMDRAALLPLHQAVPRYSSPPPHRRVQSAR